MADIPNLELTYPINVVPAPLSLPHFRLKPYIQNEMLIDTLFLFSPSIFKIIFLKIEKH